MTNADGVELRGELFNTKTQRRRGTETPEPSVSPSLRVSVLKTLCGISWHGVDFGTLSAEIRAHAAPSPENPEGGEAGTHRVEEILDTAWRETPEGLGILSLDCDLGVARMALDISVAPESPCLHIDVRRIENTSDEALEITDIALLPDAPFPEATVPPKVPRPDGHRPHPPLQRACRRTLPPIAVIRGI